MGFVHKLDIAAGFLKRNLQKFILKNSDFLFVVFLRCCFYFILKSGGKNSEFKKISSKYNITLLVVTFKGKSVKQ